MSALDLGILALYAASLIAVGVAVARTRGDESDFTLGGRKMPTPAVLFSMTATELSAATFVGVPHAAYTGDWSYLQLAVGALMAKAVLARHVIPLYHRLGVITVYGFLADRFGALAQKSAAIAFVLGRILGSGARLFIAGLALAAVTDLSISWAILAAGLVSGAYTMIGGIRAVIWTDVLQAFLLFGGALVVLAVLAGSVPGGLPGLFEWGAEAGRTRILNIDPLFSLTNGRALGTALIGAFFLTLATHATDHDMVQRLLTTRTGAGGGQALLGSALLNFPLTLLFLLIGTGLAHFYSVPPDYPISDSERILPLFALHELPNGLRGLLFAGLFAAAMSSLDSAICALATSWNHDIAGPGKSSRSPLRRIRATSLVLTLLLTGAALAMAQYHALLVSQGTDLNLVEFALSSMSILYGGLLGIFALGMTTRERGSPASVLTGLIVGAATGLLLFLQPLIFRSTVIGWPWWIPISAAITYALAASASRMPILPQTKPE
ncbi:MAG: hypothetical protein P8Q97_17490 [Myxococcota bacterium]|nr:hypothetical protein [Myxococcota bacterium]